MIWGNIIFTVIERVHLRFCKFVLGVPTSAVGQNGNGLKTDKNGNRTEIKQERNGITHPVVRTGDGNFFFMPTVCMYVLRMYVCMLVNHQFDIT